ncbi:MAG TPA: hypothetical protein VED16_04465 [Candidatus Acidoferrum sp.]|nr:hypothetical protein [Candidatus Acidoferrum sp.]
MNKKIKIIGVPIIAILVLGVLNVAAASTGTPTIAASDAYMPNAAAPQQTTIAINAPTQVKTNDSIYVNGTLSTGAKGIASAVVHLQWIDLTTGNWTTFSDGKTGESGQFSVPVFIYFPASYTFRVIYDGDSQYAPSVSNDVMVTVTK